MFIEEGVTNTVKMAHLKPYYIMDHSLYLNWNTKIWLNYCSKV